MRVRASSVNPVDNAIAAGMLKDVVEHAFPVTLGRDYAGVVDEVGADVTAFSVGDDVFGFIPAMNPTVRDGGWAELIVVPETNSIGPRAGRGDDRVVGRSGRDRIDDDRAVLAVRGDPRTPCGVRTGVTANSAFYVFDARLVTVSV